MGTPKTSPHTRPSVLVLHSDALATDDTLQKIAEAIGTGHEPLQETLARMTVAQIEADIDKERLIETLRHHDPDKTIVIGRSLFGKIEKMCNKMGQSVRKHPTLIFDEAITTHIVELTTTDLDGNAQTLRETLQSFLASRPEETGRVSDAKAIRLLLQKCQIDGAEYAIGEHTLTRILTQACNNLLLSIDKEHNTLHASKTMATVYFATQLRERLYWGNSNNSVDVVLQKMLDPKLFAVEVSTDSMSITFRATKRTTESALTEMAKKLHKIGNETKSRKKIEWKKLEAIFGIRNMRQLSEDVAQNADYVTTTDKFFARIR